MTSDEFKRKVAELRVIVEAEHPWLKNGDRKETANRLLDMMSKEVGPVSRQGGEALLDGLFPKVDKHGDAGWLAAADLGRAIMAILVAGKLGKRDPADTLRAIGIFLTLIEVCPRLEQARERAEAAA